MGRRLDLRTAVADVTAKAFDAKAPAVTDPALTDVNVTFAHCAASCVENGGLDAPARSRTADLPSAAAELPQTIAE